MKLVKGSRTPENRVVYRSGTLSYRYQPEFGNFDERLDDMVVYSGCPDGAGGLYLFTDFFDNPLLRLDSGGDVTKEFGYGIFKPSRFLYATNVIRRSPNGHLFVVDTERHCVRELTTDGEVIRIYGSEGAPSETGFDLKAWPKARRRGEIVPTEWGIPWERAYIYAMYTIKKTAGPFHMPAAIAFDKDGSFFVADGLGNAAVHSFDRDGNYVRTWGAPGEGAGKFLCVHAITVDADGRVWVGDREGSALHVFSKDGEQLAYMTGELYQPTALTSDDQYVYCLGRAGIITVFDRDMKDIASFGFFNSDLRAHDMTVGENGDLFLFPTDANPDRKIMKLIRE